MISKDIIRSFEDIAGTEAVHHEKEALLCYSYDATQIEHLPDLVIRPSSDDQISMILKIANKEGIPVVPRGAGTGFSGGSIPLKGGIVLSLERMNRVLEFDEEDLIAVVEPGIVLGRFHRFVESKGLFYPPDPSSSDFCTIGGNVAENASGPRSVKYGGTRNYVLGLEAILPDGRVFKTGARTVKSVAGYDLTRLMVGSEGTLGVVTKIILRLLLLPDEISTVMVFFPSVVDSARAVSKIIASGLIPRVLEFMDSESIKVIRESKKDILPQGVDSILILEMDGESDNVKRDSRRVLDLCAGCNAIGSRMAAGDEERRLIWAARKVLSQALYRIKPTKINEDIVVPRSKIPDMIRELEHIARDTGVKIVSFGHAGEGNLHVNVMTDKNDRDEYSRAKDAVDKIFKAALKLKGSITGEHGIGITKSQYLEMETGDTALEMMRRIKNQFDPNNILNPGKIFLDNGENAGAY